MDLGAELLRRLRPAIDAAGWPALSSQAVVLALAIAAAVVLIGPCWSVFRPVVTLVHELGHALVGLACGRRFTGFVVSGDGSGHAVTSGRARGPGRVATTWAGYPAPALCGAGLVQAALRGWAAPVLALAVLVLLLVLLRVRSLLTLLVLLAVGAFAGWLWWSGSAQLQGQVLIGCGAALLVGSCRGLAAVWRAGRRVDDDAVLASLTRVPALLWRLSWLVVIGLLISWTAASVGPRLLAG